MQGYLNSKALKCQASLFNIETKEHVNNVSNMCLHLSSFFNFSESKIYTIKIMSVFHDIGKIKIPLEILEKKEPLTSEEWEEIKKHPICGKDILIQFGFNEEELNMIIQHHEKCDGSGYPYGLTHNEIALESKILSVVDVMDALLSDRAYKKRWEIEQVREFFEKNEEGFCQEVVDVLLREFDNLINIRKEWRR